MYQQINEQSRLCIIILYSCQVKLHEVPSKQIKKIKKKNPLNKNEFILTSLTSLHATSAISI